MIRLDIARDTVSVDLNIKSARGHTSIHLTPWDSRSQYKRWGNAYKPRDRTAKQIDAFRAAERKARAILTSRHISLHRTAGRHRARWGLPPQSLGIEEFTNEPCDEPSMEYPLPPQDQRRAEAQEDMRVAHGATSTWTSENPPSLAFPPAPSCEEEDLEELHINKDQGPRSSDAPQSHEKEETPQDNDYQFQGQSQYEDVSMDEDEEDSPEDLRKATALPKEAIGLKESPANYVPKSPKYIRDSEDEGAQDLDGYDTETPHLATPGSPEQGIATQDIQAAQVLLLIKEKETGKPLVDYSSSDSVPELVDSDSEVCSDEAPPKVLELIKIPHKHPMDSKTSPSPTTAAVVSASPPQSLDASPRKRPTMVYTSEVPLATQEISEDKVIYIEDDSEDPAPIEQLTHQVDKIMMPPPVDTTLVSRKTVPLPVKDEYNQRKRGLASRRKAKPLKLQVHQVAKMRTGPVNHQRAQLMTQLTSAVVPLKKLQISETPPKTQGLRYYPPHKMRNSPQRPQKCSKMWKKQNQWKTVLKLDKNSQKETLFTVNMFNITRKLLKALKTSGYRNPK